MLLRNVVVTGSLVLLLVSFSSAKPRKNRMGNGLWGGEHIRINVSANSAMIEYDCAQGTIAGPLLMDSKGRFIWHGTHLREHGGPIRSDETANRSPAVYTGYIRGGKMKLTVKLKGTNQTMGTFSLMQGAEGKVFKCR